MTKTTYLSMILAGAFTLSVQAQQSGNNTPGRTPGSSGNSLPPGLENRQTLPPGLERRETLPPGLERRTNSNTSAPASQSGAGSVTATNGSGLTAGNTNSDNGLTPTSETNRSDRVYATNQTGSASVATNQSQTTVTRQDRAFTQEDRRLLVQVRQTVQPLLTTAVTTTGGAALPVHFVIREKTVTIVGRVPTAEQSQRIETAVQRIPGIVRVENQLRVTTETSTEVGSSSTETRSETTVAGSGSTSTSAGTNRFGATTNTGSGLTPTGPGSGTNRGSTNQPDLEATGRTNATNHTQGLPPGLQKREQLPPGLDKREQLPPGLERRSGSDRDNGSSNDSDSK